MGLFSRAKKQLLSVIEWKDDSKTTVVYRFQHSDREEIMNSSTLIVRPSQTAIFVHKGEVCDIFAPGTYKLATENIPFLTKALSLPTGFNSPIKAEVYFVNTKQFTGNKWGTQNPIPMRDKDFGNIRLRGFGVYSFKVDDVKLFMEEMFGTNGYYMVDDIANHCRPLLIQGITDTIAESKISILDMAANLKEFAKIVVESTNDEFAKLGLKLNSVVIENLSLPAEVEKALDERTQLGVMEDKVDTYTRLQAAKALRDAASNPNGGNLAGLGVGLGSGVAVGNLFAQSLQPQGEGSSKKEKVKCDKCGAEIRPNAKFCPECGAKRGGTCPKCGANISKTAKFCPECGTKLTGSCPKCKASIKADAKFCPECGEKVTK